MDYSLQGLINRQNKYYQLYFNPDSETVYPALYGGSTVLASPDNKLNSKSLQCDISKTSSEFAFILPRQGESYDTCGEVKMIHKTVEDSCIDIYHNHCDRPECPDEYCSDYLLSFESRKDAERLIEMSALYFKERNIKLGWPHHIIFSPNQDHAKELCSTPDGFKKLRSECINVVKECGVCGGVAMPHMFRIKGESDNFEDDLEDPSNYVSHGVVHHLKKAGYGVGKGGKGSLWTGIFNNALGLNSIYDYVYLSPHFHVHGYGFLKNSRNFYNETGWIYKKKGSLKNNKALSSSIQYVLSHVTRLEVMGVVTSKSDSWFGDMAYNKGGVSEVYGEAVPKVCVHGFQYYEAAINDPDELFDEVWVRPLIRIYRLSAVKSKPPPSRKILPRDIQEFLSLSELHELDAYKNVA